jgi:hypothetical protein
MIQDGYYRYYGEEHRDLKPGQLAYCIETNTEIHAIVGDGSYTYSTHDEFDTEWQFEPNGEQQRSDEIQKLLRDIDQAGADYAQLGLRLTAVNPHVDMTGNLLGTGDLAW